MTRDRYTLVDVIELVSHKALRLLPTDLVSSIGASLATLDCRRCYWLGQRWTRVICGNISRLTGETDPKALKRRLLRNAENTGRLRAEYSVLNRLMSGKRIAFEGMEHIAEASGPIIFVSAHLSNWEVLAPAMAIQKLPISPLYDPPTERGRRKIVTKVRAAFARSWPNVELIDASRDAWRKCIKTLAGGGNLLIFADDHREGLIWSPPLGRSLPYQGNRMFAAHLSVGLQATVIPIRISRVKGVNFVCKCMPPIPLRSTGSKDADAKAIADAIAEHVEEWIRADLDEWFWLPQLDLDRKFPPKRRAVHQLDKSSSKT